MRNVLLFALVATLIGCATGDEQAVGEAAAQPNILLIVVDDMGYSDISPFGGEVETPTLDALASEGLMLTNFHVLPTCSPMRSVLLSGTDNHVAGLGTMNELKTPEMEGMPGYEGYLNFDVAALPEVLGAAGYHTYMAGKWHLGDEEETIPHARGFQKTFILVEGGGSHWADKRSLVPGPQMTYRRNGVVVDALPDDFYSTRYYTDQLLEWMDEDAGDDRPFFAYLSYTAPHDPLHAPQEYIDKYRGTYDEGWDVLRERRLEGLKALGIVAPSAVAFPRLPTVEAWADLSEEERQESARDMEVYAAMIDYIDGQIARVFDHLRESGEYDNTLIVFMSDNGANGLPVTAYPGQTEEYVQSFDNSLENRGRPGSAIDIGPGWAQASMSPSRMYKSFTSEGGVRVPLLVKLPGDADNAGTMNHSFFHVRDIMPTLLDAAGVAAVAEIDGRTVAPLQGQSVLDLFAGETETAYAGADQVGTELFGMRSYVSGNWKILRMPQPVGTGEWELHDLSEDPAEMNDLSATYPDRLNEMVALWEQYKTDNGVLDISHELPE